MQMNIKQRVHPRMGRLGRVRLGQTEPARAAVGRGWCEGLWSEQGGWEQQGTEVIFLTAESRVGQEGVGCQ